MMKTNKLGMRRSLRRNIPLCLSSSSSQSEQLAFRSILFSCFCVAAQHYLRQQSNSHSPLLHFSPLPLSSLSFSLSLTHLSPLSLTHLSPLYPNPLCTPSLSPSLPIVVGVANVIVIAEASAQKLNALKKIESLSLCKAENVRDH